MFVGRRSELAMMERRYRRQGYECVVLYGRRRVGKTALIREFIRDKEAIFFTGMETTAQETWTVSASVFMISKAAMGRPRYTRISRRLLTRLRDWLKRGSWSWSSMSSRIWLNRTRGFLHCFRSKSIMSGRTGIFI